MSKDAVQRSIDIEASATAATAASSMVAVPWAVADIRALGAATSGNVRLYTLTAKQITKRAYVVIINPAGGVTTLTISLGRVSANYTDYLAAKDAKAAANTIYGAASADRGSGLDGFDFPSNTATTDIYARFVSTGGNLNVVTGSSGIVYLEIGTLPTL